MSKKKKVYDPVKQSHCPRCGIVTTHTLYDVKEKMYRCNVCGYIHSLKRG